MRITPIHSSAPVRSYTQRPAVPFSQIVEDIMKKSASLPQH